MVYTRNCIALKDVTASESMVYLESETDLDDMAGKTSEAQRRATLKWDKANTTQVKFKLNNVKDADVLKRLREVPNKAGYLKKLIREDIQKEKEQGNE